jgi:hypothetical protein
MHNPYSSPYASEHVFPWIHMHHHVKLGDHMALPLIVLQLYVYMIYDVTH